MKLLKYELAKLARPLLPLYATSLILAGCSRLLLNSGSGVMMTHCPRQLAEFLPKQLQA